MPTILKPQNGHVRTRPSTLTSNELLMLPKSEIDKFDQALYLTKQIIEGLNDQAVLELFKATNSKDITYLFDKIFNETYEVLFGQEDGKMRKIEAANLGYLTKLSESVEEELRCSSLAYFITSTMPNFEMSTHHYQWSLLPEMYKRFVVLAARDHGKSFLYSNALPAWMLYKYKPKTPKERNNNRGFLFSFSMIQATDLMEILKTNIEDNDILRERLYNKERWSKTDIVCLNRARLTVKGYGSAVRGAHPYWVVLDDVLKDQVMYSSEQNAKTISYFHGVIENLVVPGGQIVIVGCVNEDTIIPIKGKGLFKIKDLVRIEDKNVKQLIEFKERIVGKEGVDYSSHFWNNGFTKTKKIELQGRHNIECSLIHPLLIMPVEGVPEWRKCEELKVGDWVAMKIGSKCFGDKISLKEFNSREIPYKWTRKNVHFPEYVTEDLAYLIGLYLSEGNIDKYDDVTLGISATEDDIINFLKSSPFGMKFRCGENDGWRCCCKEFVDLLRFLDCIIDTAPNKDVPYVFLHADFKTQKALMQGMFDGDGSCGVTRNGHQFELGLASTSRKMVESVKQMLLNIGIFCSITTQNTAGTTGMIRGQLIHNNYNIWKVDVSNLYTIKFLQMIGFRLKRKQNQIYKIKEIISNYAIGRDRIIPSQYELLKNIRSSAKRPAISKYNTSIAGNSAVSEKKLQKILDIEVIEKGCDNEYVELMQKNIEDEFIWLKIVSIEDSESYTMDFVIPESHSFISNGIVSHNTPFISTDLYGHLRENLWKVFEYPAIFPDGSLLWENRWNYEGLMEKRTSQGTLIFSRELLVKPVTSDSTIFPIEILNTAFARMENYTLVTNRESFPVKFERVVTGCDFAISGSVGADYSVFLTWGIDDQDKMWLLNVVRGKGMSYAEQLGHLKNINANFRVDVMILENNTFQQIFVDESERAGLPVIGHTTTASNKNDLKSGLPGVAIYFERGMFKIPIGDQKSKDFADLTVMELSSVAFTSKGLQGTSEHDDIAMAIWLSTIASRKVIMNEFNFTMV